METQPMQSQTFNINNVSSPEDFTSGQRGSKNFMHIQNLSHREGIPVQRVFCESTYSRFYQERWAFKASNPCTNKKPSGIRSFKHFSPLLLSNNQTASVLLNALVSLHAAMCVCVHLNSTACLSQSRRRSGVLWRRDDRGEAGTGRRYSQERLTSPPRNTHPHSPDSSTSSVASPVTHLSCVWIL